MGDDYRNASIKTGYTNFKGGYFCVAFVVKTSFIWLNYNSSSFIDVALKSIEPTVRTGFPHNHQFHDA